MEYYFEKYRVNGKDYLLFDTKRNQYELTSEKIRRLCNHHFGVGANGIIMGYCDDNHLSYVKSFDVNGNLEEQNYNAICAFAQYVKDNYGVCDHEMTIHTISETIVVKISTLDKEKEKQNLTQISMSIINSKIKVAVGSSHCEEVPATITFLSSQVKESGKIITAEQFIRSL
ncbi:MAG: hypothetical protein PUC65_17345 [Clostridiales bacterium]|nr:hypothetical protein [Clostridiales bacterium]